LSLPQISVTREALLVDGKVTPIRAVSYSISYPGVANRREVPLSIIDNDFRDIKAAGFNAIRSYEPWPFEILDLLEAHDLYLIESIVHIDDSTNFDSEEELREIIDRAVSVVRLHRCRKSVLLWSLWNDAPFNWGTAGGNVVSRYSETTVTTFLKRLYNAVKAIDSLHPITASNVVNARFFEIGMDVVDIIGINTYLGIYDWVTQSYSHQLGEELVLRLKNLSDKYGKPIWISEMGFATVPSMNNQSHVIPQQIRLVSLNGFIGYSIFQWHDDWSKASMQSDAPLHIEANWGLRDAYRRPKPGFDNVVEAIQKPQGILASKNNDTIEWKAVISNQSDIFKGAQLLDDFSYSDNESLRLAYSDKSLGYAHAYFSLCKSTEDGKNALKIRFVPEDYGSWLLASKKLSIPIDISKFTTISVRGRSAGKPLNVSLCFRLRDGRVFRSIPLPFSMQETTTYLLPISSLLPDWLLNGRGSLLDLGQVFQTGEIDHFGFRINDVANFETPGAVSDIVIESAMLLK